MGVVPLTLLTLDAWDFIKLTEGTCDVCGPSRCASGHRRGILFPHNFRRQQMCVLS
jgi:hypothetical protein